MIHYRWHPFHGRRVRWEYTERRAAGELAHVEIDPGNVLVVPAWMLDPVACSQMSLGLPRVSLQALIELGQLLATLGFRPSSGGGISAAKGDANDAGEARKGVSAVEAPIRPTGARRVGRGGASQGREGAGAATSGSERGKGGWGL